MISLTIQHIPFLYISNPPNIYDLRRAEEVANKKTKDKVFRRWDIQGIERAQLINRFSAFETCYITIGELQKKANPKENSLIFVGSPALADFGHDRERIKKHAGCPQFGFGIYRHTDKLFLMEDICDWSHNMILWSEIRTAESIIEAEREKLKTCP